MAEVELLKLQEILQSITDINKIPCRFLFFKLKEESLHCEIEYPAESGLRVEMLEEYLKDKGLRPKIDIIREGLLTGANAFSLSTKQYADLRLTL